MSGQDPKHPRPVAPALVLLEDSGPPTQSLPGHVVAAIQQKLRAAMPEPPPVVAEPPKMIDLNKRVMMMTSPLAPHLPVAIAGSAPTTGTLPLPDRPCHPDGPRSDKPTPAPLDSRTRRSSTIED